MSETLSDAVTIQEEDSGSANVPESPESIKSSPVTPASSQKANKTQLCKPGGLTHILGSCGHVVVTATPEKCADNCRPSRPSMLRTKEAFGCPECADSALQQHLWRKQDQFSTKLEALAMFLKLDATWYAERQENMKAAWKNEYLRNREEVDRAVGTRACQAVNEHLEDNEESLTPASSLSSIVEEDVEEMGGSEAESLKLKSESTPPRPRRPRLASKLPTRRRQVPRA